jgi:tetratricopeptide (TPR) repeat protein
LAFAFFDRYRSIKESWEEENFKKILSQAVELIHQKKHSDARDLLNNLINKNPSSVEGWKLLAKSWAAEDYIESSWAYTRAAMLEKTDPLTACLALKAMLAHRQYYLSDIIAIELLNLHPHDTNVHLLAAEVLSQTNKLTEALNVLNDALSLSPGNKNIDREIRVVLARGSSPNSDHERIQLAKDLESTFNKEELSWLLQANSNVYLAPSTSSEAKVYGLNLLEKALELDPENWFLKMRWFSFLREFSPERVSVELDKLWQEASASSIPGRQLSLISTMIDLPGTALSLIRQLPQSLRTKPETALLEIYALQGLNNWPDIQTITEIQLSSPNLNPYHKTYFLLWAARAAYSSKSSSQNAQSLIDQARLHTFGQLDSLLSLQAATMLYLWDMKTQAFPFFNQLTTISSGEIRGYSLRKLSEMSNMLDSNRLLKVLVALNAIYPKDASIAAQTANLFLKERINPTTALLMAEMAYRYDPINVFYADVYARALAANNRRSEALSIYQAMPPSAFENADIRRNMQMLQASGAFTATRTTPHTSRTIPEKQKLNEQEVVALEELKKFASSNTAESLTYARKIYNLYPKNLSVVVTYALLLAQNGDCKEALRLVDTQKDFMVAASTEIALEVAQIYSHCEQPGKCLEILDSLDQNSLKDDQKELHNKLHTSAQNSLLSRS